MSIRKGSGHQESVQIQEQICPIRVSFHPKDFPDGSDGEESACNPGSDPGSAPGAGRFPWRMEWQPTPVF